MRVLVGSNCYVLLLFPKKFIPLKKLTSDCITCWMLEENVDIMNSPEIIPIRFYLRFDDFCWKHDSQSFRSLKVFTHLFKRTIVLAKEFVLAIYLNSSLVDIKQSSAFANLFTSSIITFFIDYMGGSIKLQLVRIWEALGCRKKKVVNVITVAPKPVVTVHANNVTHNP